MNSDSDGRGYNPESASKKDNAKQALSELANMFGVKSKNSSSVSPEAAPLSDSVGSADRARVSLPVSGSSPDAVIPHSPTIISNSTTITGDIQAAGDVDVQGRLKGNIASGGSVLVSGKILGDITAKKLIRLTSSTMQGNLSADADVMIDKTSVVIGDIHAKNITLDGHVKGTLSVDGLATIQSNAVLLGDITASKISMIEGAQIVGTVTINQDTVSPALFEEIQI